MEIKNCPFCGVKPGPEISFRMDGPWIAVVCCCEGPEIRRSLKASDDEAKRLAIAAWNRRTSPEGTGQ